MDWIRDNIGTILISLVLAAGVAALIVKLVKDRKKGSCSCGCADCPMKGQCHKK